MQHRYVPDVGDFGKLGLIAALATRDVGGEALNVGLVWYLTEPELDRAGNLANRDGRHVGYLRLARPRARRYRECNPALYDHLAEILAAGVRDVSVYAARGVWSSVEVRYFDEILSFQTLPGRGPAVSRARRELRAEWYRRALAAVGSCRLVLLDPDNGLIPATVGSHTCRGPKHVTIEECAGFFEGGRRSVVIYQHLDRSSRADEQISRHLRTLAAGLNIDVRSLFALRFHRGTARAYLVAPSPQDRDLLVRRAATLVDGPWGRHGHFSVAHV
jgi:hypothetical protein